MAWQHHLFYTIDREITWQQPLSSAAMVFLPARYPKSLIVEEAIIMFGCNNIPYRRRRVHIVQFYSKTNQNGYRYVNMLRYHITYTYVCIGYQIGISYLLSTSIYNLVLIYVCHFHHHFLLTVIQILYFSSFSLILSRYSCFYLGSQYPRIFYLKFYLNLAVNSHFSILWLYAVGLRID